MKSYYTKIMVLFGLLICIQAYCADTIRTFNANPQPIKTPFYAERSVIEKHISENGIISRTYDDRTRYWYQSPERYRTEMLSFPGKDLHSYQVQSGNLLYSYQPNMYKQWGVMPSSWDKNVINNDINRKWEIKNPRLLGTEEMHGLQVEHWAGLSAGKNTKKDSTFDIWISKDKRFPVVIKAKRVNPKRTMTWELTNLRIGESIPDYIITPQVNPKSGLLVQFNSRYKPLWMTIIWYIIHLLSYVFLIYSLTMVKSIKKKVLYIASFGLIYFGLTEYTPGLDIYMNQYSGLPVLILLAAMTTAAAIYSLKKFPIPDNVKLFARIRWTFIIWVIIVAVIALLRGIGSAAVARDIYYGNLDTGPSPSGIEFLLPTLITVSVIMLPTVALQEIVFRGYIMGALKLRYKSGRVVNILQALALTAINVPIYIYHFNGSSTFISALNLFIFGLILGAFRLKYRNLGASWIINSVAIICLNYSTYASVHSAINTINK